MSWSLATTIRKCVQTEVTGSCACEYRLRIKNKRIQYGHATSRHQGFHWKSTGTWPQSNTNRNTDVVSVLVIFSLFSGVLGSSLLNPCMHNHTELYQLLQGREGIDSTCIFFYRAFFTDHWRLKWHSLLLGWNFWRCLPSSNQINSWPVESTPCGITLSIAQSEHILPCESISCRITSEHQNIPTSCLVIRIVLSFFHALLHVLKCGRKPIILKTILFLFPKKKILSTLSNLFAISSFPIHR